MSADKQKPAKPKARVRKLNKRGKKKMVRSTKRVAGSFKILKSSLRHLWQNKRLFGGIFLVYLLLYVVLVKGVAANFELSDTRRTLEEALGSDLGTLGMGSALLGFLVSDAGSSASEAGSVYQTLLFIIISLAVIWSLRQTHGQAKKLSVKKAFYSSMHPFVPYVLVCLVIMVELLPALIGTSLYGIVSANGIAVGALEQIMWVIILLLSLFASIYMISSSVFASYIVTLPDMTPMTALRSARKLVKFRRFMVLRKVLFLLVAIAIMTVLLFIPLVLYATMMAEVVFLLFSLSLIIVSHAYLYELYRELM